MENQKRKFGMRGKRHALDSEGISSLAWSSRMRRRLPGGTTIRVNFPDGPSSGTWGESPMRCWAKVLRDGAYVTVGIYDSWDKAEAHVRAVVAGVRPLEANHSFVERDSVPCDVSCVGPDRWLLGVNVGNEIFKGTVEMFASALEGQGEMLIKKACEIRMTLK